MIFLVLFSFAQSSYQLDDNINEIATPIFVSVNQMITNHSNCDEIKCPKNKIHSKCDSNYNSFSLNNQYFKYTFEGVKFQIFGSKDPNFETLLVYLDNKLLSQVKISSNSRQSNTLIFSSDILPYKKHEIRIQGNGHPFEINKLAYFPHEKAQKWQPNHIQSNSSSCQKTVPNMADNLQESTESNYQITQELTCSKYWLYGTLKSENDEIALKVDNEEILIKGPTGENALLYSPEGYTSLSKRKFMIDFKNHTKGGTFIHSIYYLPHSMPVQMNTKEDPETWTNDASGEYEIPLTAGFYRVHCYGARGGGSKMGQYDKENGGFGAYVSGEMKVVGTTTFYGFVGGKGSSSMAGGFNGGGSGSAYGSYPSNAVSGGGGGATDLRIHNNSIQSRIIVAAGGSGGAFGEDVVGAPGGDFSGRYVIMDQYNYVHYLESQDTNQENGDENGQGGNGINTGLRCAIPGSGGGGGWRGGVSTNFCATTDDEYKAIAHSGSSYISGYSKDGQTCITHPDMSFENGQMTVDGYKEDNGRLTIETIVKCKDNCIDCNLDRKCNLCGGNNRLTDEGECEECPPGSTTNGTACIFPTNHFSHSEAFTKSEAFSKTEPFTKTEKFSKTEPFTKTNAFSKTEPFTKTNAFSKTEPFTNTEKFSKTEPFTKSEKFSKSSKFSETPKFTKSAPFSRSEAFSQSESFTLPLQTPSPTNAPTCIIKKDNDSLTLDRCEYKEEKEETTLVHVILSNFNNYKNESHGGAVYTINCGFECIGVTFTNCVSNNGAGGAIYLRNTFHLTHNITIENSTFSQCRANYGGAVYIFFDSAENEVFINFCKFVSNTALERGSYNAKGDFYGGSAIFITARSMTVYKCVFERNHQSALKVHNKYDDSNAKALENNETKKLILIYGCTFEREKVTDSLIDYKNEDDGSLIEISECSFKGRPEKGIKYINGKSLRKEKVQIKACKFEYNDNYERINNNLSKTEKSVSHFNSLLFLIVIASLSSLILIISIRCKSDDLYDNDENKPLDNTEL